MSHHVVHFTNNLTDGAGRAAYRLHQALLASGVDSRMMVFQKDFEDETVAGFLKNYVNPGQGRDYRRLYNWGRFILRKIIREVHLGFIKPSNLFTLNMPFVRFQDIEPHLENVDFICLHSIESFLSTGLIRRIQKATGAPIVWNVVDSEPLSGGCHFNDGCERFADECGHCPQLARRRAKDCSRKTMHCKLRDLQGLPIYFAAGSSWARDHIRKSALFKDRRIESILLSVDDKFRFQIPREMAREVLGLPPGKKIILFGCFNIDEERKGGRYLVEALKSLAEEPSIAGTRDDIVLATVGGKSGFEKHRLPFDWIDLGKITDDRVMALVFKAADVYACPSIDDFGPMMINESVACGTPVVAFPSGVAPDIILADDIGYIARRQDVADFKNGLQRCLYDHRGNASSKPMLAIQKQLEPAHQAAGYIAFFKSIEAALR